MSPRKLHILVANLLIATSKAFPDNSTIDVPDHPVVNTTCGLVAGVSSGNVSRFLGVPFAAPPVRFSLPHPVEPWQGIYNASFYRPNCVQQREGKDQILELADKWYSRKDPPGGESEDCLYLNIVAPAGASPGSKAVLVWFYGGNFKFGASSLTIYDGTSFAENQDIIVVTLNFRNGVFGFLGSPEIAKTEQNLGLYDQRLALKWVHQNIPSFGGDPSRITIAGVSSGALSAGAIMMLPPQPLPFSGVIMESGEPTGGLSTKPGSAESWAVLARETGCGSAATALDCMRLQPAARLNSIAEENLLAWGPIEDGMTFIRSTSAQYNRSDANVAHVPILVGSNADEGTLYTYQVSDARKGLLEIVGDAMMGGIVTDFLLSLYPKYTGPSSFHRQLAAIYSDFLYYCQAFMVAQDAVKTGAPVWRYLYDAAFPNLERFPGSGAYHTAEVAMVFGTYPRSGATPHRMDLSRVMLKAWADFVKDPAGGPGWAMVPQMATFGDGVRSGDNNFTEHPFFKIEDSGALDRRCLKLKPAYDFLNSH